MNARNLVVAGVAVAVLLVGGFGAWWVLSSADDAAELPEDAKEMTLEQQRDLAREIGYLK